MTSYRSGHPHTTALPHSCKWCLGMWSAECDAWEAASPCLSKVGGSEVCAFNCLTWVPLFSYTTREVIDYPSVHGTNEAAS